MPCNLSSLSLPKLCRCYLRSIENIRYSHNKVSSSVLLDLIASMPKEPKAASELRHLRMKAKAAQGDKPPLPPSRICLQVLGNGARGNPRALYMFTDHTRYLFNCSEGTQRLAHEHKRNIAKLEHIFFTYRCWENVSGLPGLSLTIQDIGVPEITIHGPPDIEKIFSMTQSFMATDYLRVKTKTHEDVSFSDSCMEVIYVPLYGDVLDDRKGELVHNLESNGDGSMSPMQKKQKLSDEHTRDLAVAYICKLYKKPGGLIMSKCVEKGVPPGPLLGELKNGKDITLSNGEIVKSVDVVSPDEPGPIFIVVECPTISFLDSLLKADHFRPHQSTATVQDEIAASVVHFSPPEVMSDPRYIEWIHRFPASTFHLNVNSLNSSLSSLATHRIQHKLHMVHPEIFPLLQSSDKSEMLCEGYMNLKDTVVQTETLMEFHLRPKKGLCRESSLHLDPEVYVQEALKVEGFKNSLKSLQESLSNLKVAQSDKYPELVFLGTGSMIPSKVRNVSAILVNINNETSMLLDCGEGTSSQLFNFYGKEANSVLLRLKCVFVSHHHADHHLGLIELMKTRERAFMQAGKAYAQLMLIAPSHILTWLKKFHTAFEPILHYFQFLSNYDLHYGNMDVKDQVYEETYNAVMTRLALQSIETVPVRHCKNAYGVVLKFPSGFKLVYSGDTMPCDELIKAGKGCSVLIHEATMEDELEKEAKIKTHSTTSQAIDVGVKMQAGFTILTHFSQRYSKIPIFNENFHDTVAFAFDNMRVRPCDLPVLPLLTPTLKCLFAEDHEEMQEKTKKRLQKKKLMEQAVIQEAISAKN